MNECCINFHISGTMDITEYIFEPYSRNVISLIIGVLIGFTCGKLFANVQPVTDEDEKDSDFPSFESSKDKSRCSVSLIVNSSLKMGKGKVSAQCGHAILSLMKKAKKCSNLSFRKWVEEGQNIEIVSVKSSDEFDDLIDIATMELIPYYVVADAGRTQIKSGSLTVLAIGPAPSNTMKNIMGQLPLYL